MIASTPGGALREAGGVAALLCCLVAVALLLVRAAIVGAGVPAIPPYDDGPWLALNPPEIPLEAFEGAARMTQEALISRLGPPLRVRRDADLPAGCHQSYVYATRVLGERTTTGVCFDAEGRITSFVGQTVSFDAISMTDDPRDALAAAAVMSLILALPWASILAIQRRLRPLKIGAVTLKEGLR